MSATILVYAFFLHFVADFLLQSREMGKNKSSQFKVLVQHLLIQFWVVGLGLYPFVGTQAAARIALINTIVHGVIDWNIWRGYKALVLKRLSSYAVQDFGHPLQGRGNEWHYWEDHWFYATIGLDQFLHMATLVVCLKAFLG